jgi:hypothetical protein
MLTEEKLQPIFTDINPNTKTIIVAIDSVIKKDGVEVSRSRERCAFVPGDIEGVKAYTGLDDKSPEIIYLNAIWSAEVIAGYKKMQQDQAAQEAALQQQA